MVVLLEELPESTIEALLAFNRQIGLDLLTGEGWVLLAGSRSRLAAFARPWTLSPELAGVATAVGQALPGERPQSWQTGRGVLPLTGPVLLGILNLTPDSFSDGGLYLSEEAALLQAERLLAEGAEVIDIGGESTRPGAIPVPAAEERARVLPVIDALVRRHPGVHVSIDTVKAEMADAALDHGAAIVNDVSGLRMDSAMAEVVARHRAGVILMHSRGTVADMATMDHADYGADLTGAVVNELKTSLDRAAAAGIAPDAIVVDPGLGFSKTADQTLRLLDQVAVLSSLGRPILVGPSRKRFLGVAGGQPVTDRDRATATACVMAYDRGAQLFRVHKVAMVREALAIAVAVRGG